jgi:glycosyltransferase involved in cell wall biosynthesis
MNSEISNTVVKTIDQTRSEPLFAAGNKRDLPSVLHVGKFYPPHRGGVETHLQHLVSHQSGHMSVEVVVANDRPMTQTELMDGARITRVACLGSVASLPICPTLPWKLTGRSESILHLHVPNPWAVQSYLMSGHKGKLVVTHHADTLGRLKLRRLVDPFVRRTMERAEAIIVTSKRYLESSEELANFRSKCRVVPLGIDARPFRARVPAQVCAIEEKYGKRIILAVGRLVYYKGFEFLLEAMQDIDATLLLIGTGPAHRPLQSAVRQFGVANKAHLLGPVDDLVPYYKAAMMLVLPSVSRAESFGMVQVEAMLAGIPVINTEIDSGVPEVSVNGETGITVPPKDPVALAGAIRKLLDSPATRARYGQAGTQRALREYSARRMAESTFAVYDSIL